MTLEETVQKINTLQHLIGQNAPKWNRPILEIIPAPMNDSFTKYMETYEEDGNVQKAIKIARSGQFGILLIFSMPQTGLHLVYEWYGFFYTG